jgi:hypothetical protein
MSEDRFQQRSGASKLSSEKYIISLLYLLY